MSRIIYTNKQSLAVDSSIQDRNKITSLDMNNIKLGINQSMSYAEGNTVEANKYYIGYSGTLTSGDIVNIKIPNNNYTGNATLSILGSTGEYKNIVYEDGTNVNCADIKNQYIQLYYNGTNFVYERTLTPSVLANYYTKTETDTLLGAKEDTNNKVTSISSASTDTQYPSAKCVYDYIDTIVGDINTALDTINGEVI